MRRLLESVDRWISILCALIVAFMMITICYEVIVRYFFNSPTSWTVEINSYLLVYIVFLMAGVLEGSDGHIQVDAIRSKLSTKKSTVLSIITKGISLAAVFVLFLLCCRTSWNALIQNARFPDMMSTPQFPVVVVIPFGLFIVSVHLCIQIFDLISLLGRHNKERQTNKIANKTSNTVA